MKKILLSRGKSAIVSDCDFERVNQFRWNVNFDTWNWYAVRKLPTHNGKQLAIKMHRFILNAPKNMQVDHKNGDGLCNLRSNLRLCTNAQNQWNQQYGRGKSLYKGVYWHKKKWNAQIKISGKVIYLGVFEMEKEAAQAYDIAASKYFGEFACLNLSL